jgi:hypothetical protein
MGSGSLLQVLGVVVALAAGLLLPAGVAKLRDPRIAIEALGLRRRGHRAVVRLVGAGELLLAAWVLFGGGRAATAVLALTYGAFTSVAARQRRRGAGCGCFGSDSSPTSRVHLGLNLIAAAAAGTLTITGATVAPVQLMAGAGPLEAMALLLAGGAAVVSAQLVLTALPELALARRRAPIGGRP